MKQPGHHRPLLVLSLALLLASALSPATPLLAATFTVGTDGACTHPELQGALLASAINGPTSDTIRLARNTTYTGQYLIDNQSVLLVGGYDTCADTSASSRTVVTREFDERAFEIRGTANGAQTIELANLDVRFDGSVSAIQGEGGMIHLSDGHFLFLSNTNVEGGSAALGGGVFVDDATLIIRDDSTILDNHATQRGGGAYCQNGGNITLLHGLIGTNLAGYGGGLALASDCLGRSFAGGFLQGIYDNTAELDGGGIHVDDGADFELIGSSDNSATISSNDADRGGGIFITDFGSSVRAYNATIDENSAVESGGGVYLEIGSTFLDGTQSWQQLPRPGSML